jgi:hypothetical protein
MGRLSRGVRPLLLPALALALALPVPAGATVLQNGRFLETTGMLPTGWRVEAWAKDATDVMWEPAPSGKVGDSGLVRIVNRAANDARLCQTIPVTPGGAYRVSARVKTEGVGTSTAGALIAIEPRIADSVDIKGTQDWQTIEVTAANQEAASWDICVRLGSYANLNTGTAWFSDVQVEQVGGPAAASGERHWPALNVAPVVASIRQTSWIQTALPLVGGLLVAFGLGIFGRRTR